MALYSFLEVSSAFLTPLFLSLKKEPARSNAEISFRFNAFSSSRRGTTFTSNPIGSITLETLISGKVLFFKSSKDVSAFIPKVFGLPAQADVVRRSKKVEM